MKVKFPPNNSKVLVKKLRVQKLRAGQPFMINTKELSTTECYLEYPDGSIVLVSAQQSKTDINILRRLSDDEAKGLRKRLNFTESV